MTVAFVVGNDDDLSNVRGIGSYTLNLKQELENISLPFKIDFVKKVTGDYDLIHYPSFDFFFHTLPAKSKAKRIVTIHDVIPLIFPEKFPSGIRGRLNLFLQKRSLSNIEFVICDSETSKKDIINKLPVAESKVHVIYLAAGSAFQKIIDEKKLASVKTKYKLPDKFCLYVGDVNWNKNVNGLVEAISICKVPLVMVGQALNDTSLVQTREINSKVESLEISGLVTKTGYVTEPDLISIYSLATVTVVPSFYEGFGLPVLESMACGTPVICSDNSSLHEIGKGAAIFCNPSDSKDISAKIYQVMQMSSQEINQLSKIVTQHANKYSYSQTAKETVELYQKALK